MAGEDPIISGMAGRYASALFELAREEKAIDAVKADLDRFDALIAGSPDLNRLVRSPVFGVDEQLKALSAILDKAGIKGLAANFLRVITTNRRLFARARHDPRLPRAGRPPQGRGQSRRSPSPKSSATRISTRSRARSNR